MAKVLVEINVDDAELTSAIKFLGSTEENVQSIKDEYVSGVVQLDLTLITDPQKRYYHTNGLTAMLISVKDDIQKSL